MAPRSIPQLAPWLHRCKEGDPQPVEEGRQDRRWRPLILSVGRREAPCWPVGQPGPRWRAGVGAFACWAMAMARPTTTRPPHRAAGPTGDDWRTPVARWVPDWL